MDACLGQKWGKEEIPVFFINFFYQFSVSIDSFCVFAGVKGPFTGLYVVCVLGGVVFADDSRSFYLKKFFFQDISKIKIPVGIKFTPVEKVAGIEDSAVIFKVIGDYKG